MCDKFLAAIFVAWLLISCSKAPTPPLPPLLRGATAGGGSDFLCDPLTFKMQDKIAETRDTVAHSPEIVARLQKQFPRGSSASELERALISQGFVLHSCKSQNVKLAVFKQTGHNGVSDYQSAHASVTWKTDAVGRVVWTTGNIAFTGL